MSANGRISWAFGGLFAGALLALAPPPRKSPLRRPTPPAPSICRRRRRAGEACRREAVAKPKKPAGPPTVDVVVTNMRKVALTSLLASASGSPDSKKIAGPLAPGKKVVVHLAHDKDCLFDLHGVYEDGANTDAIGVELCKDKTINLVE